MKHESKAGIIGRRWFEEVWSQRRDGTTCLIVHGDKIVEGWDTWNLEGMLSKLRTAAEKAVSLTFSFFCVSICLICWPTEFTSSGSLSYPS